MTTKIQERVGEARTTGKPLRIAGRSTWLDAGRPVNASETISLANMSGVVDYVPGDLTITVRAGTSLAELARITGEQRQWLPLNPFGSDEGTIGATVATGSFGPLAHAFGTIRDLILGLEVVTGEPRVIRGGGRVVKNVAGFDLVRLMTGAWGTLGVITEVTLRLYAVPSTRRTMALEAPTDTRRLAEKLRSLLDAQIMPFALELLSTETARHVGLPPRPMILIELGGNSAAVASQTDALRKLGTIVDAAPEMWERLQTSERSGSTVFRTSGLPARLAERWDRVARIAEVSGGALMHASIGRGIVRCILPDSASEAVTRELSAPHADDTVILETASPAVWAAVSPSATTDRVSQNLRHAFDPRAILNTGILGPIS